MKWYLPKAEKMVETPGNYDYTRARARRERI